MTCPLCKQELDSKVKRCVRALVAIPVIIVIAFLTVQGIVSCVDWKLNKSHVCIRK